MPGRFVFMVIVSLLPFAATYSQYQSCLSDRVCDTLNVVEKHRFPVMLTTAKVLGINTVIWSFDRFIVKEDWAYISGKTIKRNFRKGFIWDSNCFTTNMFSHPFHGSLYYNSARSSGLTWAQSIPFVLGGSFMWEFFMESEYPSTNDLFATTFGGIALGEMSFRATDLFLDNCLRGVDRISREVVLGILSPMRAIHRLITGEAWKKSPYKGSQLGSYPFELTLSLGARALVDPGSTDKCKAGATFDVDFQYGELSEGCVTQPYEWFYFDMRLNAAASSPFISKWRSRGLIYGKTFEWKSNSQFTLGAFQHFMYYDLQPSETHFTLGEAMSFGAGCVYRSGLEAGRNTFTGELYLNAVPLGAVGSDYMVLGDRDYNWGAGYGSKAYLDFSFRNGLSVSAGVEMTHLFSWNGYPKDVDWDSIDPDDYDIQGDKSRALCLVSSLDVDYMFNRNWGISLTYNNYYRHTRYEYMPDRIHDFNDLIISAVYSF